MMQPPPFLQRWVQGTYYLPRGAGRGRCPADTSEEGKLTAGAVKESTLVGHSARPSRNAPTIIMRQEGNGDES